MLNKHFDGTARLKMSKASKGKSKSALHALRIGQALTGLKRTEENIKNNSEAQKIYHTKHPERSNALGNFLRGKNLRELFGEKSWDKRMVNQKITRQSKEFHQKRSAASKEMWENYTPERKEEIKLKRKIGIIKYWENLSPMDWKNRIDKTCSLVTRISKNQLKLHDFLKNIFPTVVLEYPVKKKIKGNYLLDIALVEDKIDFEYDSIRWHTEEKHVRENKLRDDYLQELGWSVIRIREPELRDFMGKEK